MFMMHGSEYKPSTSAILRTLKPLYNVIDTEMEYSQPMVPTRRHGPPSVIHAGLMRTGTLSMARAYEILDLRAHHALDTPERLPNGAGLAEFNELLRAAEATWPEILLPNTKPSERPTFDRKDWDALFGDYDAVTDVVSMFAPQLIEIYPKAKVVIVKRDFEPWFASFEKECLSVHFTALHPVIEMIEALIGVWPSTAVRRIILGAIGARNLEEVRANARAYHENYYAHLLKTLPPDQRLVYKLSDGWEPLCAFLGKPVPNVPFPHVNNAHEHQVRNQKARIIAYGMLWRAVRPYVLASVAVVIGIVLFLNW